MKKVEIWAHRGASAYAPENTLAAFKLAVDMDADGVELDVQMTKDEKLVVIHDETIQRVSNGYGYVRDFTLAQLKELCFNKTCPEYEDIAIPTLREVFQLLKPTSLKINIELKTGVYFYKGIEQKVIDLVADYGMEDRIWYSSFNHYCMKRVQQIKPDAKIGLLYSDGIYEPAAYAKSMGAEALHPAIYNLQYPEFIENCRQGKIRIHPWTVNSFSDMAACIQMGVDAVITNYPDRAKAFASPVVFDGKSHYLFENPFQNQPGRPFYLFGAGYQGGQFLKKCGFKYHPRKILDNAERKWGTQLEGVEIMNPINVKPDTCVVIASNYFIEIIQQLMNLGVREYYVYDEQLDW